MGIVETWWEAQNSFMDLIVMCSADTYLHMRLKMTSFRVYLIFSFQNNFNVSKRRLLKNWDRWSRLHSGKWISVKSKFPFSHAILLIRHKECYLRMLPFAIVSFSCESLVSVLIMLPQLLKRWKNWRKTILKNISSNCSTYEDHNWHWILRRSKISCSEVVSMNMDILQFQLSN